MTNEARMTNDERGTGHHAGPASSFELWNWSFIRHSSFVIRH
jgi:hypothetical protein